MKEGLGRKFVGLLIALVMLLLGLLIVHFLKMKIELYETYAKWIIRGLYAFVGGNSLITGAALLSNNTEEKK